MNRIIHKENLQYAQQRKFIQRNFADKRNCSLINAQIRHPFRGALCSCYLFMCRIAVDGAEEIAAAGAHLAINSTVHIDVRMQLYRCMNIIQFRAERVDCGESAYSHCLSAQCSSS